MSVAKQGEVHGCGRLEHSLCGLAFDAFETGDHEEPVVFAKRGEMVTCVSCRAELDHVREFFKGYRYAGSTA